MSKILIIGDTHFGIRNNSLSYLEFQKKWFNSQLMSIIEENGIDDVVIVE